MTFQHTNVWIYELGNPREDGKVGNSSHNWDLTSNMPPSKDNAFCQHTPVPYALRRHAVLVFTENEHHAMYMYPPYDIQARVSIVPRKTHPSPKKIHFFTGKHEVIGDSVITIVRNDMICFIRFV